MMCSHHRKLLTSLGCSSSEIMFQVRQTLSQAHDEISELFRTFAAAASGGSLAAQATLELPEFTAFFYATECFRPVGGMLDVIQAVFYHALGGNHSPSMDRPSFLASVVVLAWLRFVDCGQGCSSMSRKLPVGAVSGGEKKTAGIARACERTVDEYLKPLVARGGVGHQVRSALRSEHVLGVLCDYHAALRAKFELYAQGFKKTHGRHGEDSPPPPTTTITLTEFGAMIESAGLVGKTNDGNGKQVSELTAREVRQAFAGSQGEQESGMDQLSMNYLEMLEAVLRISFLKYDEGEGEMSAEDKVAKVCEALCKEE